LRCEFGWITRQGNAIHPGFDAGRRHRLVAEQVHDRIANLLRHVQGPPSLRAKSAVQERRQGRLGFASSCPFRRTLALNPRNAAAGRDRSVLPDSISVARALCILLETIAGFANPIDVNAGRAALLQHVADFVCQQIASCVCTQKDVFATGHRGSIQCAGTGPRLRVVMHSDLLQVGREEPLQP
jgi:hypothetical protein